jgi:hypothetical protein
MTDTLTAEQVNKKMDTNEMTIEEANENTKKRKEKGLCLYCDDKMVDTVPSNPSEPDPPVCEEHHEKIA